MEHRFVFKNELMRYDEKFNVFEDDMQEAQVACHLRLRLGTHFSMKVSPARPIPFILLRSLSFSYLILQLLSLFLETSINLKYDGIVNEIE
jgi:hypothetical protein